MRWCRLDVGSSMWHVPFDVFPQNQSRAVDLARTEKNYCDDWLIIKEWARSQAHKQVVLMLSPEMSASYTNKLRFFSHTYSSHSLSRFSSHCWSLTPNSLIPARILKPTYRTKNHFPASSAADCVSKLSAVDGSMRLLLALSTLWYKSLETPKSSFFWIERLFCTESTSTCWFAGARTWPWCRNVGTRRKHDLLLEHILDAGKGKLFTEATL